MPAFSHRPFIYIGFGMLASILAIPATPVQAHDSYTFASSTFLPTDNSILEQIHYNPTEQGPLLWIGKPNMLTITLPTENAEKARADIGKTTVHQLATNAHQRLIHEGNLSALVLPMMEVIPEKLPDPDPLADMTHVQRIQVLLSLLTGSNGRSQAAKTESALRTSPKNSARSSTTFLPRMQSR